MTARKPSAGKRKPAGRHRQPADRYKPLIEAALRQGLQGARLLALVLARTTRWLLRILRLVLLLCLDALYGFATGARQEARRLRAAEHTRRDRPQLPPPNADAHIPSSPDHRNFVALRPEARDIGATRRN